MELRHVELDRGYAAVFTPRQATIIGLPQIEQWETSEPTTSAFDLKMLAQVRDTPEKYRALVFVGRADEGPGCYRIDDSLTDEQVDRASFQIVRHTMPTFRALAALGVRGVYHVAWEPRDVSAMQRAKDRFILEIPADKAERKLDSFVLHRTVFFVFSDLQRALDRFIPSAVSSIERDAETLQRLLDESSTSA